MSIIYLETCPPPLILLFSATHLNPSNFPTFFLILLLIPTCIHTTIDVATIYYYYDLRLDIFFSQKKNNKTIYFKIIFAHRMICKS